jgi:hypothetical protein
MGQRRYSVTRTMDATPETVWALLTDATSYADWNPAVVSIKGPITKGATIELVSVVSPKRTFKLTVSEMDEPNTMVWSDGMPLGLFKGVRTYRLVPEGGATLFSMTEEFSGLLAGPISKSIPDMTDSFDDFADGLKAAAENKG